MFTQKNMNWVWAEYELNYEPSMSLIMNWVWIQFLMKLYYELHAIIRQIGKPANSSCQGYN